MPKHKTELLLLIVLIPILAYVGWQVYNTYLKPPSVDLEELEKVGTGEPAEPVVPPTVEQPVVSPPMRVEPTPEPSVPKGTLDYTGYTERDPLKPSLPVREKIERPPELPPEKKPPKEEIKKEKEPPKEIVLPTFTVTGIVWGDSPRAIIDQQVYKIGDTVKGAKILDITEKGIKMIYEGKEFSVKTQ